ncbi:PKD domain-containing protein [Halosimplex sp. J119]
MLAGGRGVPTATLWVILVVGAAVSCGAAVADAASSGNEAPLADAGLDQNVTVNTTVYLDATASRDPDGEVAAYEWRLEQPNGEYTRPDCRTCGRTSFVPRQVGTYNATVTVTDSDGATSSDTLRVTVTESDGPTVTLSGPEELNAGEVAEYTASVEAGNADLAALTWRTDGNWQNRTRLSGTDASTTYLHAFTTSGEHTVSVTVVDRLGREDIATQDVTVHEAAAGGIGGDYSSDGGDCSRFNRGDDLYCNNDRMTVDSNGITITDADNDGNVQWGGQTLDEEFAQNNDGVSYDSTDDVVEFDSQEAYRESLEVDTVNVDPTADMNQNQGGEDSENTGNDENTVWKDIGNSSSGESGDNSDEDSTNPFDDIIVGGSTENGEDEDEDGSRDETNSEANTRTGRVPPNRRY